MILEGIVTGLEDDCCYTLFEIAVEGARWRFSAVSPLGDSQFCVGFESSVNLKIDSVVTLECLEPRPDLEAYIVQREGISIEAAGRVFKVVSKDEIEVEIPEFGGIEVSLEYDSDIQIHQWVRFRGCLCLKQQP